MRLPTFFLAVLVLVLSLFVVSARADTTVLGSAASFAVLGGSAVTNTPTSVITGDVGIYSGTAISGFNSTAGMSTSDPQVSGTVENDTAVAEAAQASLYTAIIGLNALSSYTLSSTTLGAVTFTPGVYSISALTLNGTVTLNAGGQNNVDFIFLVGALTDNANVVLEDPGSNDGVYWVEGSSATVDGSTFVGNVLAYTSITIGPDVTITCGSALANTTAVTLDGDDTITTGCNGSPDISTSGVVEGAPGPGSAPVSTTPEPGTFALFLSGLLAVGLLTFRKSRVSSPSC